MHIVQYINHILDLPLTEKQTEVLKRWVSIGTKSAIVLVTLLSIIYAWRHRSLWSGIPILAIAAYVVHRILRTEPRRCPHCSDETETKNGQEVEKKERNILKVIFGGWFIRRKYWREPLPVRLSPDPDQDKAMKAALSKIWLKQYEEYSAMCHFHCVCSWCDLEYPVKPPTPHSVKHRRRLFWWW